MVDRADGGTRIVGVESGIAGDEHVSANPLQLFHGAEVVKDPVAFNVK